LDLFYLKLSRRKSSAMAPAKQSSKLPVSCGDITIERLGRVSAL
jgi:hypothetical protein